MNQMFVNINLMYKIIGYQEHFFHEKEKVIKKENFLGLYNFLLVKREAAAWKLFELKNLMYNKLWIFL